MIWVLILCTLIFLSVVALVFYAAYTPHPGLQGWVGWAGVIAFIIGLISFGWCARGWWGS